MNGISKLLTSQPIWGKGWYCSPRAGSRVRVIPYRISYRVLAGRFRPYASAAVMACLMLLIGACATQVREFPPPVNVPTAFSASGTRPLADRWWLDFDDPELNALMEEALSANLTLQLAWDRLAQVEAIAKQQGAPLYPSLDANADLAGAWTRRTFTNGNLRTDSQSDVVLGIAASYELDLWGRIRATRDAAALEQRATAQDVQATAITITAQVASTWYQVTEQVGQLNLLDEQIATNAQVLELVTLRFRQGQAGAADVLRQRQLVEATRGERIQVASQAEVLSHQLAVLLGQPPRVRPIKRQGTFGALTPLPDTGAPAALVSRRPDIQQAFFDVLAADQRVAAALADRYPRISLVASSEADLRDVVDNWMATLAANLLAPVFDGGRRAAEVDRTQAVVSQRLHEYGQRILDAFIEVENALVQETQQRQLIDSLDRQLDLSQRTVDQLRNRYTKGAVGYLDVLNALLTHQALQRNRLTAQRQLLEFRINLCRALGGGWKLTRPALASLVSIQSDGPR